MSQDFDYIIIGAGSAGCVLANRLSEDPATRVLVLEYGGSDKSIFIQMPTALSIPMNGTKYNWKYMTLPEPGLNGRQGPRIFQCFNDVCLIVNIAEYADYLWMRFITRDDDGITFLVQFPRLAL